jgi:hypothetical protein
MQLLNNSPEKPQTSISPDHQNQKFDSKIFRKGIRLLVAGALTLTISSCGETPAQQAEKQLIQNQNNEAIALQAREKARLNQERLDREEELQEKLEARKKEDSELTQNLFKIDKKILSLYLKLCPTFKARSEGNEYIFYVSNENRLKFQLFTKEIIQNRRSIIMKSSIYKSGNYGFGGTSEYYYYDDLDYANGISCNKMRQQNNLDDTHPVSLN